MSVGETSLELANDEGLRVRADVRRPEGRGPFPVVVILHGFKGFRGWGMFPPTARRLAERGLASVTLDASRNGVGARPGEFTELDSFARNTPRREVLDVRLVVDAIDERRVDTALDPARIGLLGHSRGGGVVILEAAGDPRVKAVAAWAGISTFLRWTPRAVAQWRERGRIDVPNARTGQVLWLTREVLEDLEARAAEYDLEAAAGRLRAPLLVVHGEQDEAVPFEEGEKLHTWAGSPDKSLLAIPRAGHTFGAVHPWAGPTPAWEQAVEATAGWFARVL
jgi:dienelactone hydrolase